MLGHRGVSDNNNTYKTQRCFRECSLSIGNEKDEKNQHKIKNCNIRKSGPNNSKKVWRSQMVKFGVMNLKWELGKKKG